MRLDRVITAVRDNVNDRDAKYWKDNEIVRWISYHARQFTRLKVNADDSYSNYAFEIQVGDTTRVSAIGSTGKWTRYYLPSWVYRIYTVWDGTAGNTRRKVDPIMTKFEAERGWKWSGDRSIDVIGHSPISLEVECAKLPPALHYGCIRADFKDKTKIILDHQPTDTTVTTATQYFDIDEETDSYIGVEIEFTGGQTDTRDPRGRVHVVTAQSRIYNSMVGDYVKECTIMPQPPDAARVGDTYVMHVPVDESALEYFAAAVSFSLFKRTKNLEGMAALRKDLEMGKAAYLDALQPRQEQAPKVMEFSGSDGFSLADVDRDYILE